MMDAGSQSDAMAATDANGVDEDGGPAPQDAMAKPDAAKDAGVDAAPRDTGMPDADMPEVDAMVDAGPVVSFEADVRTLLLDDCEVCHSAGGVAASTDLLLGGSSEQDLASVKMFVDVDDPDGSALLAKMRGEAHGGGVRFADDSEQYATIVAWIEGGAAP